MIKRLSFSFLFILLFINVASATSVAYIVSSSSSVDLKITDILNSEGYTYDIIENKNIPVTDFSDYDMILVWDGFFSNFENIPVLQKKTLLANLNYLDEWGIANSVSSRVSSGYEDGKILKENSITKGFASPLRIYNQREVGLYYLPKPPKIAKGIINVFGRDSPDKNCLIGIINPGGDLYGGGTANERIAIFTLIDNEYWTEDTEELFKRTVEWVIEGPDDDGDGFSIEIDCDDTNPLVNPNALEIPYDGIDNDCVNGDLVDVDGDGYDSEVVGGSDCDDNDSSINPSSEDVYKNCMNDAPNVEDIDKITVKEGDLLGIAVDAEDPEGDELTYSINDSRFEQEENIFTWQTEFNSHGTYNFEITVSDGEFTVSKNVEIEIRNTNQPPFCEDIPPQYWNEDEDYLLDLNDYCYDPDGDYIVFALNNTSANTQIILNSLDEGIANFSSEENWNGSDWIIFKVSDGKSEGFTEIINLEVLEVNDAPYLNLEIEDLTWDEDTNLYNEIDLYDYFNDIDSENLVFEVSGNNHINITISESRVSFSPEKDWYGVEIISFTAIDEEFSISSNEVRLEVLDKNEPPQFGEMNCEESILEDNFYSCEIEAIDPEGDDLIFEVYYEDNLHCDIVNNTLEYHSFQDYSGAAECFVKVSDQEGYDIFNLDVIIESVNDAPKIVRYSPTSLNPKILENTNLAFSITAIDIDSSLSILWFLNEQEEDSGTSYTLNENQGYYNLTAIVSDEEFTVSQSWNVLVGDISEFTCSEIDGYVCTEDEVCKGDILGVSNTDSCCSIPCSEKPPEFSDIKDRKNITPEIEVKIDEPSSSEEFYAGDVISVDISIDNRAGTDIDFEIYAYLYDLTEDNMVDKDKVSIKIDNQDERAAILEIKTDEDIEDENDYAIFVRVEGEGEDNNDYYNEDYVEIDVEREKNKIVIKDIQAFPNSLLCGDYLNVNVKVANLGSDDQEDVIISIENSPLDIKITSEEFELERYGEDDISTKIFDFKIPDKANKGDYNIKVTVFYDSESVSENLKIYLEECNKEKGLSEDISTLSIGGNNSQAINKISESSFNFRIVAYTALGILGMIIFGVIVFYIVGFVSRD
jgi:hypothetical protein